MDAKKLQLPKNLEEVRKALEAEDETLYYEKVKTLALLGIFYELHELDKTIGRISNKLSVSLGGR